MALSVIPASELIIRMLGAIRELHAVAEQATEAFDVLSPALSVTLPNDLPC